MTEPSGSDPKRCAATRKDGQQCMAPMLSGGAYCFAHDPERAAERVKARNRGGQHSANVVRLRGLVPLRLMGVYDTLEQALADVRDGKVSPQRGNSMATIAGAMVRILMAGELEQRLRTIEEQLRSEQSYRGRG